MRPAISPGSALEIEAHDGAVYGASFSPDGELLATAGRSFPPDGDASMHTEGRCRLCDNRTFKVCCAGLA